MPNIELLEKSTPVAPVRIAALAGCQDLANEVDKKLVKFRKELVAKKKPSQIPQGYSLPSFLVDSEIIRFGTGEGKGHIKELDAVQGVLQPYILVLSAHNALVVFSQKELMCSQVKVEQLIKKLYNRFTMYQAFAPDMPYKENLKNYEEARTTYQDFLHSEGHYKNDVAKTLTYIENNYMHRLTLSSISANVNLSTSYLCRVFKSEVGTSITSYLNNLRIRKAATLIKENTFSLKEISVMVGIDDQLYFSRLFKKCMGISPSEYGKRFHL